LAPPRSIVIKEYIKVLTNPLTVDLRPFWVATTFVNYASALPMIELDLRRVEGTSEHHAEAIACRTLLEEIGRTNAHIICALGKPEAEVEGQSTPLPPAVPPVAPPPPPAIQEVKALSPRARADALADAKEAVANVRGQLLSSLPRGDSGLGAPTYAKLKRALQAANFAVSEAELWNVASTLLGRVVSRVQPLKEADGRAVLAFLESATPEQLDLLFPVAPMPEAG
jgi:hypothetical protein